MCARYTLTLDQARLVIAGLVHIFAFAPRYNIGPAQRVPVLLDTPAGVKTVEMRWGIPSAWSKTLHINAQAERIQQTTTFKPLLAQRCLVPMDGFYEWKPDKSPCGSSAASAISFAWPACGKKSKSRALTCRWRKNVSCC